jgi:Na+/melibiose symporter-like transporter
VVEKEDLSKMGKRKRILLVGFFVNLIIFFLFINSVGARPNVYYGQVVGIEFSMLHSYFIPPSPSSFLAGC